MTKALLKVEDSRRLTGPNLFFRGVGAVLDVSFSRVEAESVLMLWKKQSRMLLDAIGWNGYDSHHRLYTGGASFAITAPIDALYAATEVNEAVWQRVCDVILQREPEPLSTTVENLTQEIKKESNTKLKALQQAAKENGVRFLSDDDQVSLGYGKSCQCFPVDQLPDVSTIDWASIDSIPVALVTGTNGKSTTVRLAASVMKAAGLSCGITSTDYIRVGEKILDKGDYSGPGGARTLLRHPDTEMALLEVARGGMLRRGLGINQASCAVVTNVAADHLGDYGINTVEEMIEAKFVVRQAINADQDLILNADDAGMVNYAATLDNQIVWFSWHADNAVMLRHIKSGGKAAYLDEDRLYYQSTAGKEPVLDVKNIPITMSGAARHNLHNALAVVAMSRAMGIDMDAIRAGLSSFHSSPENNPGRGNLFALNGFKVLVDFAHNEHGLSAMAQTLNAMGAKRKLIMLGQAGDRNNELIKGLVKASLEANPDCLVICEMADYLRGKELGETPELIEGYAMEMGMHKDQIIHADSPLQGAIKALNWARSGDALLLLALTQRAEVIELIKKH